MCVVRCLCRSCRSGSTGCFAICQCPTWCAWSTVSCMKARRFSIAWPLRCWRSGRRTTVRWKIYEKWSWWCRSTRLIPVCCRRIRLRYTLSHRECGQFRPYVHENFKKIQNNFDPDGQLDSIAPEARLNPTARRGRNYFEFFKIFMNIRTELSTLSMGQSIAQSLILKFFDIKIHFSAQVVSYARADVRWPPPLLIGTFRTSFPLCPSPRRSS